MVKIVYEVVEHDGGWAYRVNGAFSERFDSHSDAIQAATIAAKTHQQRDESDQEAASLLNMHSPERLNLEILDCSRNRRRFSLSDRV